MSQLNEGFSSTSNENQNSAQNNRLSEFQNQVRIKTILNYLLSKSFFSHILSFYMTIEHLVRFSIYDSYVVLVTLNFFRK